ncbi:hypothetical protein D1BOALGB6SA_2366 [Olavius sp. associated proteobacterium Delta 1]|nr:hypothetical protein D1BOALGB6SA_2366 [Olavius sp. associated proteobacterium Delta 1]
MCIYYSSREHEKLLKKNLVEPLLKEAEELTAIFASSRKTASTKN